MNAILISAYVVIGLIVGVLIAAELCENIKDGDLDMGDVCALGIVAALFWPLLAIGMLGRALARRRIRARNGETMTTTVHSTQPPESEDAETTARPCPECERLADALVQAEVALRAIHSMAADRQSFVLMGPMAFGRAEAIARDALAAIDAARAGAGSRG